MGEIPVAVRNVATAIAIERAPKTMRAGHVARLDRAEGRARVAVDVDGGVVVEVARVFTAIADADSPEDSDGLWTTGGSGSGVFLDEATYHHTAEVMANATDQYTVEPRNTSSPKSVFCVVNRATIAPTSARNVAGRPAPSRKRGTRTTMTSNTAAMTIARVANPVIKKSMGPEGPSKALTLTRPKIATESGNTARQR